MADEVKSESPKDDEEEARKYLRRLFEKKPELNETLHRIGAHLHFADDIVLVVLKGHLLIEESLTTIIRKFVPHGEFIDEAGLRFYQKVQIARSLSLDEHENGSAATLHLDQGRRQILNKIAKCPKPLTAAD